MGVCVCFDVIFVELAEIEFLAKFCLHFINANSIKFLLFFLGEFSIYFFFLWKISHFFVGLLSNIWLENQISWDWYRTSPLCILSAKLSCGKRERKKCRAIDFLFCLRSVFLCNRIEFIRNLIWLRVECTHWPRLEIGSTNMHL